jgi:Prohead core protein serine protease
MTNILTEYSTFNQANVLLEGGGTNENGKPKDLYMKGIFIQGDVRNHNQRIYPANEIQRAVSDMNERMKRGESIVGEADHPEELNINIDRISHEITEMRMDGVNGIGKLKIIPTPMGSIIRTLLESGIKLGVSSRGSGNVDDRGEVSDFQIVTVDVVVTPSAPDARPEIFYETLRNSRRWAVTEDLAKSVLNDRAAQKYLKEELLNFISSLK